MNRKNRCFTPPLGQTRILGSISTLMDNFFEHRIFSDHAQQVVYREAEDAFRNQVDDLDGITGTWQGEFWGKLILSAVGVCEYTGDEKLKEFIRQSAHNLLALQESDGYLGTYRDKERVYPVSPVQLAMLPKDKRWCRWNWNIWCRKYTLWGLIETYRLLGDPEILAAADKFAGQLIAMLHEKRIRIADTGMFVGLPSCSILKPIMLLFDITGKKDYLDFALEIASCGEEQNGRIPNLITNSSCSLPLHEWYPEGRSWTKVYEMLSCMDGLLELYRHTGEPKYFDAVKNLYQRIKQFDLNPMFSVGVNDQLGGAAERINSISEPCDVIHWMRIASELFLLTGNSEYMDDFELAYCNSFLASINRSGEWGSRALRSHGRHYYGPGQVGLPHNHCCVNNMPRGFMNAAAMAVTYDNSGIFINLYFPFEATVPHGKVKISGNYPAQCGAIVDISHNTAGKIYFRIPSWSKTTRICYNGKVFHPQAGIFFEASIDGNAHFELTFDQEIKIKELEYKKDSPQAELWFFQKFDFDESPRNMNPVVQLDKNVCTLQFGPLLLARSKYLNCSEDEMFASESIYGQNAKCKLIPLEHPEVRYAFTVEISTPDGTFQTNVCDYASAANEIIPDPHFFSIFF